MEVELKYTIRNEKIMDALWHDEFMERYMKEDSRSVEEYDGVYYDTEDFSLLKNKIAYRIRKEGAKKVACVKWAGGVDGALHERNELNVTLAEAAPEEMERVSGEDIIFGTPGESRPSGEEEKVLRMRKTMAIMPKPDLTVFNQSEIGQRVEAVVKDKEVQPIMEVLVVRKTYRIDTGSSMMEVALDKGKIIAGGKEEPILELEIELYTGERQDLLDLGKQLEERYRLVPETRSKFARGLALLGLNQKALESEE